MTNYPVKFKRTVLSVAILAAASVNTFAQESSSAGASDTLEEVVVTGIRRSLTAASDIKRDASGVVDAISAEDIGKFPDTNLAESLQRITGVSIDRSNNEGNSVTVRGFGPNFNLVTMNGRQMPNSSALQADGVNRSFNFQQIAAESVSGVEVYKTGKANVTSGGIGSTINIKTARPFDFDGFQAAGSVKGVIDTSVERGDDITPEISGTISNVFADGKFGVLLALSQSNRDSRLDRVGTQGWVQRGGNIDTSAINTANNPELRTFAPWTVDVDTQDFERTRQNGQLVLQFAPNDRITGTVDYTVSNFDEQVNINRQSFWFNSITGTADENGTVLNPSSTNEELDFFVFDLDFETENESVGLNLDWQVTDTLNITFDYHDSTSHAQPGGGVAETLANIRTTPGELELISADFSRGDIPSIQFVDSDNSLPGGPFNASNIISDLYQQRGFETENNIEQIQIHGVWENADDGALRRINFGIANTDYQVDTLLTETFEFVNVPLDDLNISFDPIGDTADEFSGTENLFPLIGRYDVDEFLNIVQGQGLFVQNPPTANDVNEETQSFYVSFDFDTEFNSLPVRINAGVRWEETDITAVSIQPGITGTNFITNLELRETVTEERVPVTLKGNYTRLLPNLDVSIDLTDQIVTRFSYSRTLGRPNISALFPSLTVNLRPGGPFLASQGNPNLSPLGADNLDFSFEWYYDEGSYASVGYFRKFVEDFVGSTVVNGPIFDVNGEPLRDPTINPRPGCPDGTVNPPSGACLSQPGDPIIDFEITTPGNLEDAIVDGWELNIQHLFGASGFGIIANYTMVDGDLELDLFDFDQTLALTGLSDSANLIGFYEKGGIQLRAAYNWRDEFLSSLGAQPTFTEAFGQLDINASYDINDSVSVFFEALNVLEETTRRYQRFEEQLVDAEQSGVRYNIGVRSVF